MSDKLQKFDLLGIIKLDHISWRLSFYFRNSGDIYILFALRRLLRKFAQTKINFHRKVFYAKFSFDVTRLLSSKKLLFDPVSLLFLLPYFNLWCKINSTAVVQETVRAKINLTTDVQI